MDFTQLSTLLEQAQVEQGELETANAALATAKDDLTSAQSVVAAKQTAVAEASAVAGSEKNDVIAVLQQMQTAIADMLASLQG